MGVINYLRTSKFAKASLLLQYAIYYTIRAVFCSMWLFPIKKKRVIFLNFNGRGYGCNPKYMAEHILNDDSFEKIWLLRPSASRNIPDGIKFVNIYSLKAIYYWATAQIWISNNRMPLFVAKRRLQFYLQTYHGALPVKQIEGALNMPPFWQKQSKHDSSMIDLLTTDGDFSTDYFSKVFWYHGEFFQNGVPRTDILINNDSDRAKKIKKQCGIDENKKVVIYAPTFRNSESLDVYKIDVEGLKKALEQRFGCEWVIVLRLHPVLFNKQLFTDKPEYVIDMTNYPDIQELLLISDVCITDYSSVILDFMKSKKPGFIFATDYDAYAKERNYVLNPKQLPFPFAESNKSLVENILNFNMEEYKTQLLQFNSDHGIKDNGHVGEQLWKIIEDKLEI